LTTVKVSSAYGKISSEYDINIFKHLIHTRHSLKHIVDHGEDKSSLVYNTAVIYKLKRQTYMNLMKGNENKQRRDYVQFRARFTRDRFNFLF
jgi:hypothetical protein